MRDGLAILERVIARLRFYLPLLGVANFVRLWGARRVAVSLVWFGSHVYGSLFTF